MTVDLRPSLLALAHALQPELVTLRRRLHQIPELDLELPKTQAAVLEQLDGLGLEVTTGRGLSSVVAVLRGGRPGPAVLLRSDMDGLPVTERTGLDYASTNGRMHACGHDLHMAGLVGAARLLAHVREELPGDVVLMFQPGEEASGGARIMLDEGVLDAAGERVVSAYGLHVMTQSHGAFTLRPGTMMAGANLLAIDITGRGGHGSMPHRSVDPVPVAAAVVQALQHYVARSFDVFDPVVITVGELHAGSAPNVIPETASLRASVRTLSAATFDQLSRELPRLVDGIVGAFGASATTVFESLYPVTVNDTVEASFATAALGGAFGADRVEPMTQPVMGSEDFSYVLDQVPGAFVFLGVVPPGVDPTAAHANHSAFADFDDRWLGDQAAALAGLAVARLERAEAGA